MALEKITQVSGTAVYVPGDDIDTDRIIPARFMKCITFDGLGEFMFYDVRKNEDGSLKQHPLNDPQFAGASIILSGNNFGCGSSREHAPQAIAKAGFKGVIAEGFAEIFFGNSTTLGLPLAVATKEDIQAIVAAVEADPSTEVTIDVKNQRIRFGDQEVTCYIRESARASLVEGTWDPIAELLEGDDEINATARELPYV
ncbi:MAG: 3-isopropylmalate dehydratase small subunit [Verrucomicrobiae bacterium]|nr:3-isopropylmalate dehydratase small subunit [Verrucomicrobiae bacterium]